MTKDEFHNKYYDVTIGNEHEKFMLFKSGAWITIRMITNGKANGEIVFRNKAHLEQLHFALGQLLND